MALVAPGPALSQAPSVPAAPANAAPASTTPPAAPSATNPASTPADSYSIVKPASPAAITPAPAVNTPAPTTPAPAGTAAQPVTPATATASTASPTGPKPGARTYTVSPGDTLDIAVYDAPDLSEKAKVATNGDIYMPLVQHVHLGGLSLEEAQAEVERSLRDGGFLKAPHVTIAISDFAHGVDVLGEVSKPGTYPIAGSKRLSELIAMAGGTTTIAGQSVTITRWPNGEQDVVPITNDPAQLMKSDAWVHQGDTVVVGKAGVVYVVGEVLQPAEFVMQDRTEYTVVKAVAMAHGTTKQAKLSQVRIVRKGSGGAVQEIPIQLDKILASKSPDVPLLPDDIVYVPTNKAKNAAISAGQVALSLATALTIIGFSRY